MAQRNFLPRGPRLLRRAPGLVLCLLAGPLAHAASVTVEVRERPGEQAQHEPRGPPEQSRTPRQEIALRHLTM